MFDSFEISLYSNNQFSGSGSRIRKKVFVVILGKKFYIYFSMTEILFLVNLQVCVIVRKCIYLHLKLQKIYNYETVF